MIVLATGDYKKELGKIAHCALADYIMEVQKGTLHTSVKVNMFFLFFGGAKLNFRFDIVA